MSKETEKFIKDFRATEKRIKELSIAEGNKLKKRMTSWLETTWKVEDLVSDAVQKARISGNSGSKAADFVSEPDVLKYLKEWKAAVTKHHKNLDVFQDFCKDARELHGVLTGRIAAVEKELKKKKTTTADVKILATIKDAKRAATELKKSAELGSSIPAHMVFYARKLQASIEAIVRDALKKVDPKEFPKSLQEANRKKTLRTVKGHERKIHALFKSGTAEISKSGDLKKAANALKLAKTEFAGLEKFSDEFSAILKKMRKELKEHKESKEMTALIKITIDTHKSCDDLMEDFDEKLEKAEAAV